MSRRTLSCSNRNPKDARVEVLTENCCSTTAQESGKYITNGLKHSHHVEPHEQHFLVHTNENRWKLW